MGVKIHLGVNSGPTFHNEKTGNREPKDESLRKEMGLPPYSSRWSDKKSKKSMKNQTNKTEFWAALGQGIAITLIILSVCLGFGGCEYLCHKGTALVEQAEHSHTSQSNTNL